DVIAAFGNFVVRGNYVVGAVIFLILTLIQFLVIAKGSERVAEVGARFTLDAMPGKQMSIDAELRSGGISQDEARKRRDALQRESQFYGAMDGAMKFVKGDAIAGIVITIVNLLGGLAIGVAMRDMSAADALGRYGLLTIGDGLVSQIPALLISTSAGLVVTRVASAEGGGSLGADVASQVFGNARALKVACVFLLILAAIPGLPALPFIILAAFMLLLARGLERAPVAEEATEVVAQEEAVRETEAREAMVPLVVPVSVEVGIELGESVADASGQGPFLELAVPALRDQLFVDLGIALPAVRARSHVDRGAREYVLALHEVPVASGRVESGVFVVEDAQVLHAEGFDAVAASDPTTGLMGAWVQSDADALLDAGYHAYDAAAFVARHLGAEVSARAAPFVGIQETQTMLDQLERAYPALVRQVTPKPVSVSLLAEVLRRLVEEGVSIRPLREILEALAVHAPTERDPVSLTEHVRTAIKGQITHRHADGGRLAVFLLDPEIEEAIRDSIQRTASGTYLALPPAMARDIIQAVSAECGDVPTVLLTQADIRRFVRRLLQTDVPRATVLSYAELSPSIQVEPLGRIGV
ncbi:MAG: flagellar biosynthesis protein FlhA, partial [Myxococcota bacterium]